MPDKLKTFSILKEFTHFLNPKIKTEDKQEQKLNTGLNWKVIWRNVNNPLILNKIQSFQWKCVHNILFLESIIEKFGNSDGKCHFCKVNFETNRHLFYECHKIKPIINCIERKSNESFSNRFHISISENIMLFGVINDFEKRYQIYLNFIIFSTKWIIWKTRNEIKFQNKIFFPENLSNRILRYISNEILFLKKCNSKTKIINSLDIRTDIW